MAAVARQRIQDNEWKNVEVLVGDAATATLPSDVDGILFFETHDVMRTPAVVRRAIAAGRPGAGVVAFGPASAPRWSASPSNAEHHARAAPGGWRSRERGVCIGVWTALL
jgi:hypothetical protein